jgi:DNA-binding transcriptional LysR family regulator
MSLTRSLTGGIAGTIVDAYRARYPEVELVLGLGTTMLHAEQLHAGEIDVGFVRPPLEEPGLEELRLGREPMVCVLPRGHRLTRRSTIRPRDLDGEPLVWWPEEHGPGAWREVRREVCGEPPWPPLARAEPEEERIVSAVAEGAGISFIMLERSRSLRIPGAVYRRFAPPEPTMGIALAWQRGDQLPTLQRLIELASELMSGDDAYGGATSSPARTGTDSRLAMISLTCRRMWSRSSPRSEFSASRRTSAIAHQAYVSTTKTTSTSTMRTKS